MQPLSAALGDRPIDADQENCGIYNVSFRLKQTFLLDTKLSYETLLLNCLKGNPDYPSAI